jgi:hypothetical protein
MRSSAQLLDLHAATTHLDCVALGVELPYFEVKTIPAERERAVCYFMCVVYICIYAYVNKNQAEM